MWLRIGTGCYENRNEPLDFIKCGESFDLLGNYQLLKKGSAAWSVFVIQSVNQLRIQK
jgi:hypothetical protein